MMRTYPRIGMLLAGWLFLTGCGDTAPAPPGSDDGAELRAILGIPARLEVPAVPDYNQPTRAKIALGRHLFYDKRLSGNQTQSCASCHEQKLGFADGKQTPTGSTGDVLVRNSPGLANAFYHATLTWANDGLLTLESQIPVPIRGDDPVELGVSDGLQQEVLARFDADSAYVRMLADAYPESPSGATINKIVFALASFCRTLVSADSPYDRYIGGDKSALTDQQRRGLALFNGERLECFHCHSGTNLTVSYHDIHTTPENAKYPFFNNGLYNVGDDGGYPAYDQGLYEVTLDPKDRGLFRPQSLRNVALTAPYMHDGSIATLRDVIKHYAAGGRVIESGPYAGDGRKNPLKSGLVRGFQITEGEIDDVVAFLESLTDTGFTETPAFSSPFGDEGQ
ncbi:Methylamine utilization protein mauG [Minicystis rosea]|nr:Methylamine utilization protein mauG [Minicystis rosea]